MNNKIYINGTGIISPQKTFDNAQFLDEIISAETNQLRSADPIYKELLSGDMVRRMSRIIKMGVAASKICLKDAICEMPDAIITGTGLGCLEDTEKFLASMIHNKEEFLTPTSFIQSTHNTVSAQIALLLKCHHYNFTYVHRGISFESALLDSLMKINSGEVNNVLLGSSDELTYNSFTIMERMGFWKRKPVNNLKLFKDHNRGTIAGEGSAFFFLSREENEKNYAVIRDVDTFIYPDNPSHVESKIMDFLSRNDLPPNEVDLIITGKNGDPSSDQVYHGITGHLFPETGQAAFKHLCGEYHTAVSFAFWIAAKILKTQRLPEIVTMQKPVSPDFKNILIYNHYRNINHSLILFSKA